MYKAIKSFSGVINMKKGEVKDIVNKNVVEDLLRVGYIEALEDNDKPNNKRGRPKKEAKGNAE